MNRSPDIARPLDSIRPPKPPPTPRMSETTAATGSTMVWIAQADFYVTANPTEVLSTILGSCIAVCIHDPVVACGGMNHFLLPSAPQPSDGLPSIELRYGSYSIERLINAVLSRGGRRERLQVKVFGGSNVLGTTNIGHYNADFVEAYLEKEGLPIVARDLRGSSPRRIHYFPTTGVVKMARPRDSLAAMIFDAESQRRERKAAPPSRPDVEIFAPLPRRARRPVDTAHE